MTRSKRVSDFSAARASARRRDRHDAIAGGLDQRRQQVAEERRVVDQQDRRAPAPPAASRRRNQSSKACGRKCPTSTISVVAAFDHGIAEQARTIARHFDVKPVFDDVDDLVDQRPIERPRSENTRIGCAPSFRAGFAVDAQQRHQLIAILHQMAAVGDFDPAAIDLLEPGDERQRHGLRLLRAGAEQQERNGVLVGVILGLSKSGSRLRRRRGAAERLGDAVRIDDHDDRAVAEDGGTGEHRDVPQLRRHRLDHDFLGMQHAVDHGAENLAADLDNHDEAVVAVVVAEPQRFIQMNERQQLVAQPQHRRVLDPLDAVLAAAAGAHQFEHGELRDGEALAAGLDDQRRDDGKRQRDLDGEVVPAPGTDFRSTVPPICSILLRTTSMPTPRPEMLVIWAAVRETRREDVIADLGFGLRRHLGFARKPEFDGLGAMRAMSRPRPSSAISMMM